MKRATVAKAATNRSESGRVCRVIATFGAARLVRQATGRHELIGGSASNQTEAREWCSLFAPEVVFGATPSGSGSRAVVA